MFSGEGKALLHFRIANGSSDSTLPLVQYYYTCASDETVWLVKSGSFVFLCVKFSDLENHTKTLTGNETMHRKIR